MNKTTRRTFLSTAAAGAFFIPARTLYGQELPRKQLRLAMVGAGGIGAPTYDLLCKADATAATDARQERPSRCGPLAAATDTR